jgi:hypothetical protein
MAFHEVWFPDTISRGARGGPERRTQVVELASGDEERNASWANSCRRYDVACGIRLAEDVSAVAPDRPGSWCGARPCPSLVTAQERLARLSHPSVWSEPGRHLRDAW